MERMESENGGRFGFFSVGLGVLGAIGVSERCAVPWSGRV